MWPPSRSRVLGRPDAFLSTLGGMSLLCGRDWTDALQVVTIRRDTRSDQLLLLRGEGGCCCRIVLRIYRRDRYGVGTGVVGTVWRNRSAS